MKEYSVTSKSPVFNRLKRTEVTASKYKVPKVKVLIMQIGPFQNNIYYLLIIIDY